MCTSTVQTFLHSSTAKPIYHTALATIRSTAPQEPSLGPRPIAPRMSALASLPALAKFSSIYLIRSALAVHAALAELPSHYLRGPRLLSALAYPSIIPFLNPHSSSLSSRCSWTRRTKSPKEAGSPASSGGTLRQSLPVLRTRRTAARRARRGSGRGGTRHGDATYESSSCEKT